MTDADLKLYNRLSTIARRLILLDARHEKFKRRYKERRDAMKTIHDRMVGRVEAQIAKNDAMLWRVIDKNRDELTPSGERSFTTRWVRFQFKKVSASTKVKNADKILVAARRRRALQKVGRRVWALDSEKFLDYLKENPEERQYYQDYLEEVPEHETLSIKLNEGHDETFDNVRLTPKAVSVKKSPPR